MLFNKDKKLCHYELCDYLKCRLHLNWNYIDNLQPQYYWYIKFNLYQLIEKILPIQVQCPCDLNTLKWFQFVITGGYFVTYPTCTKYIVLVHICSKTRLQDKSKFCIGVTFKIISIVWRNFTVGEFVCLQS